MEICPSYKMGIGIPWRCSEIRFWIMPRSWPTAVGLTCSWSPTTSTVLPRYSAISAMTSLWLASSMITTSKRALRGSKFSTTRRQRHDPHRHSAPALPHLFCGFRPQHRHTNARALADSADGVEPADQRLALPRGGALWLERPTRGDQSDRQ